MSTKLTKYLLFLIILSNLACATYPISRKANKELDSLLLESSLFNSSFTGFALFDPERNLMLYQHQADKYYTPASNTKIYTFYTALEVLGDSLPVLHYQAFGDSLLIWGTGNPLFLHPDFPADDQVLSFLRSRKESLLYTDQTFRDDRFGDGWMWDDFPYYFQAEKTPFPIYSNLVTFRPNPLGVGIRAYPGYFQASLTFDPNLPNKTSLVRRREFGNIFTYNTTATQNKTLERAIPFQYSAELFSQLLTDTLGISIRASKLAPDLTRQIYTLYQPMPDTLYRRLMQESDNFIAEQLLLLCSDKLYGLQQTDLAIKYAREKIYQNAPDPLLWYDGSGLTRYNLFTPRTTISVLNQLYQKLSQDRLFSIFPGGGQSGTVQSWYPGPEGKPYIFAKTGTLRNVHALSGYLLTKRNKVLIFSFMHNNFPQENNAYKKEMQKVLAWIWQAF